MRMLYPFCGKISSSGYVEYSFWGTEENYIGLRETGRLEPWIEKLRNEKPNGKRAIIVYLDDDPFPEKTEKIE